MSVVYTSGPPDELVSVYICTWRWSPTISANDLYISTMSETERKISCSGNEAFHVPKRIISQKMVNVYNWFCFITK